MKLFLFPLILLTLISSEISAQADSIRILINELDQASGGAYISKSINLAKLYIADTEFDEAVQMLDQAIKEARKMGNKNVQASVNTGAARTILENLPAKRNYVLKACVAVENSMDTEVIEFYEENLRLLRKMEPMATNNTLKQRVQKNITTLESRIDELESEQLEEQLNKEYRDFKKQGKEAFIASRNQSEDLKAETEKLGEVVDDLAEQRERLAELNRIRKEQIDEMNEEQLKNMLIQNDMERLNDSLERAMVVDSLETVRLKSEVELAETRTNLGLALLAIVAIVSLFLFNNWRSAKKHNAELESKNEIIENEKQISENLLLNILPGKIADELKTNGFVETKFYKSCSVLFADFVNFSNISKTLSPQELIKDLHFCFSEFDKIVKKLNVEKIKTIGDAYMCAAGVPEPLENHADILVKTAFRMQEFLADWNADRRKKGLPEFNARIGIHSGPVIGGVVGTSKFAFDVWGDTVNTAGRMESASEPGRVNISSDTRSLLKGEYIIESRGKLSIKNMDDMDAYFVSKI